MNRLPLLRLLSVIHAIKCNKTTDEAIANASLERLLLLKKALAELPEGGVNQIKEQITVWAGEAPIATDREINDLINKKLN